ncbi:MAG: hypothetical protein J7L98_06865 [Candidatus Verstraetearchaeota archaeon]|nr:hypothetical protein [Candidatus Verstraetearchaeota archaeon]
MSQSETPAEARPQAAQVKAPPPTAEKPSAAIAASWLCFAAGLFTIFIAYLLVFAESFFSQFQTLTAFIPQLAQLSQPLQASLLYYSLFCAAIMIYGMLIMIGGAYLYAARKAGAVLIVILAILSFLGIVIAPFNPWLPISDSQLILLLVEASPLIIAALMAAGSYNKLR